MKHVNPSLVNAPQKMQLKNTMNKLLLRKKNKQWRSMWKLGK